MNIVLFSIFCLTVPMLVAYSYFYFPLSFDRKWFLTCFFVLLQFFGKFLMDLLLQLQIDYRLDFYLQSANRAIIVLSISILVQARLTETVTTRQLTRLKHKRQTHRALSVYLLIISCAKNKISLVMIALLVVGNGFGFHHSTSFDFEFEIIVVLSSLSGDQTRIVCFGGLGRLFQIFNHGIQI